MNTITPLTHPVLAFDLDATLVEEVWPEVGEPHEGAIETVNKAIAAGYEVILWTARGGDNLKVVKRALFDWYGVNPNIKINDHSHHFTAIYDIASPKVNASVYFDDKSYLAPDYSLKDTWDEIQRYLGL